MAISYPTSKDALTNPVGTDMVATVDHASQHGVLNDIVEALMNIVGVTANNFLVPSGGIIMWSGNIAAIPAGWFLCNGSNSTPDLRDKFIVGAKEDDGGVAKTNITGSLLASGGANTHNHTYTDVVTHTHSVAVKVGTTDGTYGTFDSSSTSPGTDKTLTAAAPAGAVATGTTANGTAIPTFYSLAFIMKS